MTMQATTNQESIMQNLQEIPDGLYFGMSDENYHAIPRLSASGIKNLLMSGMDFWAWSWMNKRRPTDSQDTKDARTIGKAYHKRILEGREAFDAIYAPAFDASTLDQSRILKTKDDMAAVLETVGVKMKSAARSQDYVDEVKKQFDETYIFVDEEIAKHAAQYQGKILLSASLIEQIEICAMMIEKHEQLCKVFVGGYAEVTVLWTCEQTGVKMKARLDYLKIAALGDLKSFTNKQRKSVEKAVYSAMANEKYHIQSAVYYECMTYARNFARTGKVFGEVNKDWIKQFGEYDDEQSKFVFVFQQKGVAPVTRGYIMPKMMVHGAAVAAVQEAKESFLRYMKTYGEDPWIDTQEIRNFEDSQFPAYITDL